MRLLLLMCPVVALAAGCSNSESGAVTVHPVTGKVMYDGKPAAGVQVILFPTDAPTAPRIPRNPYATTKDDGTFAISTFADGDGAAEGGYQILLNWPKGTPGDEDSETDSTTNDRLLGWYDAVHSKFNVRVKPGPNELPVFNLPKQTKPPPVSEGVPGRN